ncbi:MAG: serine/threonine-protein kinase [Planctomycetota bacterium]
MKARFGRYVFLKKLADGGMAEIFLARRLSFGGFAKFVVIKRLLPEYRGHRTYEKLFLAEARTGALLNHPNIVSLHDLGSLDDAYFIAMEYVDGLSGAELMNWAQYRKRPLPIGVALRQVVGVAEALEYCSSAPDLDGNPLQVIHHDISPHNVQISFEGAVKLLDFGVATRQGAHAPGGRRGKFAYMSPEAIAKQPLDHRSDLYSLGVVLYELTTGRRLFKGKDAAETRALATQGEITRPTTVDAYYPESLEEVVLKALARDKDERFQHARALHGRAHGRHARGAARRVGAPGASGGHRRGGPGQQAGAPGGAAPAAGDRARAGDGGGARDARGQPVGRRAVGRRAVGRRAVGRRAVGRRAGRAARACTGSARPVRAGTGTPGRAPTRRGRARAIRAGTGGARGG